MKQKKKQADRREEVPVGSLLRGSRVILEGGAEYTVLSVDPVVEIGERGITDEVKCVAARLTDGTRAFLHLMCSTATVLVAP